MEFYNLNANIRTGDLIRHLRVNCKISQEYLANDVGIAVSTIERIENGKVNPRIDTLEKILALLKFELIIKSKND